MTMNFNDLNNPVSQETTYSNSDSPPPAHQAITLDEEDRNTLIKYAAVQHYSEGDVLVEKGADDANFYLLISGNLVIESASKNRMFGIADKLEVGELIGLLAFFTEEKNPQNIVVKSDSEVAVIDRNAYIELLSKQAPLWQKLQLIGLHLMRKQRLANSLDKIFGPFGMMLPFVMTEIEHEIEWIKLERGETLFSQGEQADAAFVLVTGRLQMLITQGDGRETLSDEVLAGQTIGETALLTEQAHAHSVYALRDSEVVKLSNYCLELMLQRNTRAIHNISRILGKRLTHTHDAPGLKNAPVRCISLLQADENSQITWFSKSLEAQLSIFGKTEVLSSKTVDKQLDTAGISQTLSNEATSLRLDEWLYNKEETCQFLIYQSDNQWSQWSDRCVKQTDQIVVVASANAKPDLSRLTSVLTGKRQKWSLVLLHEPSTIRPHHTVKWFSACTPDEVYHVRENNLKDIARLARILSGNAISLVLGGGGARGFAHLGVLQALDELDIPIDLVCGTSMGAPLAGMIAQGAGSEEVSRRARRAYHKIIDVTLPIVSIIAGKRISETIREQTQGWDIEDYWLPFFCVSTNLTTGLPVVHRRGDSWLAIRASVSIPGILPPVPSGSDLLVDGGVLNNLPVDIMRELNPFGTIIAVDVAPPVGPKAKANYGTEISGWKLLAKRILPWLTPPSVPSMGATIMQSMVAGSALKRQQILEQDLADLYLNIHVKGVGILQFDALEQTKKVGYDSTFKRLKAFFKEEQKEQVNEEN